VSIWSRINPPPRVRAWAYNVTIAGLAVAGVYGLVDGEQIAAWGLLGAAVLGIARGNVTPSSGDDA
jgi:hypothetical protein